MKPTLKDRMVALIRHDARVRAGRIAGQLVRNDIADKEELLAEMEITRDLAELCTIALDVGEQAPF